ncbi:MAG TPA: hypothetical protein VFX51_29385 [Solirubrobacteraceae bacterium]|nr:hypothetical protein [Solirubrobacteraceae bacterium]
MAEKSGKKTKKKAAKADTGVLGNLSATRPSRIGGDRRGAPSSRPAAASAAKTATAAKPKAAKPKAAKKASKPKVRTNAGTQPKPPAAPPKGWQAPDQDNGKGSPDLVSTAVQAAGEIAQLGLTVGGQFLKRAAGRIPRP